MSEVVTFDGNDLSRVPGLSIIGIDPHRPPARELNKQDIANADKSTVVSTNYKSRAIHVMATIGRANKSDLQSSLRTLESYLQTREGLLVVPVAGFDTEFTATKENVLLDVQAGGFAEIDIEFFCSNPTGYANTATTLYNYPALVGSAYSFAVTWDGNVRQQPVLTITYTAAPAGSASVTIGNSTTSQALVITRSGWTSGEVLVVDFRNKSVQVDGVDVPYTGPFPEWTGTEPITYADTLASRTMAVNITYKKRNI